MEETMFVIPKIVLVQFDVPEKFGHQGLQFEYNADRLDRPRRKGPDVPRGVELLEPAEGVAANGVPNALQGLGYVLVGAKAIVRKDRHNRNKRYWTLRFTFSLTPNQESAERCRGHLGTLQKILGENIWRLRAYLNPDNGNGQMLSLNLGSRVPLFENGERKEVWQKDEKGKRVGETKVPLEGKFQAWNLLFG